MRGSHWLLLSMAAAVVLFAASTAFAASPPAVVGFQRFHEDDSRDGATLGRLLLGELNCTSCHRLGEVFRPHVLPKQAPVLDGIGRRVSVEFLKAFLTDPHGTKPGTTMPDVLTGLSAPQRDAQVDALVHYLASTGSPIPSMPDPASIARGKTLFHRVGCVACHGPQTAPETKRGVVVPLGNLAQKYGVASLSEFLQDPLQVRPSGRMPHLNLDAKDARDIACYLLREIEVQPNVGYRYFEGRWADLPDFSTLPPKKTGQTAGFDVGIAPRGTRLGLRFDAFLPIAQEGTYTFHLGSDDGSRLSIGGRTVVENDGVHPFQWKSGRTHLAAGSHPVVVEFFQADGGMELRVEYEGPGLARQPLDGAVTLTSKPPQAASSGFQIDLELVAQGRALFAKAGCASCHQMREGERPIGSQLAAKPLSRLKPEGGCLVSPAAAGLPNYHLSDAQRRALSAALSTVPTKPPKPAQTITRTLTAFNCYACHTRDRIGGVQQAHNEYFRGTIPEMGDEGRLPPHLDGIGDKLNANWIRHVLDSGAKDRPYMPTRMPRFGQANTAQLVAAFAQADAQSLAPRPELADAPYRMQAQGRFLVGDKALSCIKCHTFGPHKATGIQAIDLTKMTRRLREDWFNRYMINPQVYRPGTRMPSAWPNGKSVVPSVLEGDTAQQLAAIWLYLSDAEKAAVPQGLIAEAIELVPDDEPIVYRNFIQGLSARGIAVGYPEKAHLAFDAEALSLALIWHGAFFDASKHWTARGAGFQAPLGDHVLRLVDGPPFAQLDSAEAAWPTRPAAEAGYKFHGYRLDDDRRPTFIYTFDGIDVQDFPKPVAGKRDPGFHRTLTLTFDGDEPESWWYRAARAATIEDLGDGTYMVDGGLTITLQTSGAAKPVLRERDGQKELLVPVVFRGHQAVIEQTYHW